MLTYSRLLDPQLVSMQPEPGIFSVIFAQLTWDYPAQDRLKMSCIVFLVMFIESIVNLMVTPYR